MKKLIVILAFAAISKISAQPTVIFPYLGTPHSITFPQGWLRVDSGFLNAIKDTILAPIRLGEQRFRSADSAIYVAQSLVADNKWIRAGIPKRGDSTINVVGSSVLFRDYINVKSFGATGNGTTNDRTAISNAFAAGNRIFFPPGTYKISGRLDLPDGKTAMFSRGAYFIGTGSATDSIENLTVEAPYDQKIFDTTISARKIRSATGAISGVWFGMVADCLNTSEFGTTDNYNPLKRALLAMYDTVTSPLAAYQYTKRLFIPAGRHNLTYYISNTIYIGGQIELFGDGVEGTILNWPRGVPGLVVSNTSYGNTAQFANPQDLAAYRCYIHDMSLSGFRGYKGYFAGYYDAISHGITLYAGSTNLQRIEVINFLGDGVRIYGANENYMADVECDYNAGNGFNFMTADGNANTLYRCVARWSGKYGFHDVSFLGNFAFNCNSTTNGGHYQFNRTAITSGGKFFYCKKDVVWRVTHNGHHYTCILAHNSGAVDAEPGVGSVWQTYWTDQGVGSYSNQYINWETFQDYITATVQPLVTVGWQNYYDSTIDFQWANNAYDTSTQFVGGGAYYMEGANQTGSWIGLYTEFDENNGYNNSSSYVAFGNGGAVIYGANGNGWSQKWSGGYMSFPALSVITQNNQAHPNSERWWSIIKGPADGTPKTFGWYNSATGNTYGLNFDTTGLNIDITAATGLITNNITSAGITNTTYTGSGKMVQNNQIGVNNASPAASAIVDITSTTQGFLGPRMNTTQQNAIGSPATGLMLYNTDSNLYRFYNGTAWTSFGGGGGGTTYTFSTGLTNTANTITNNLSTGVTGGQTLIGSTSTTSGLVIKSTTANGTTGSTIRIVTGNNGATECCRVDEQGEFLIGYTTDQGTYQLQVSGGVFLGTLAGGGVGFVQADGAGALSKNADFIESGGVFIMQNSSYLATPKVVGGQTVSSSLTLQSTSGVGTTGADIIFKTGNNGATEAARILNSGLMGVGTASPTSTLNIGGSFAEKYTSTATGITLDATHGVVEVTATGQTITLPTAVGIQGRIYTIKLTASGTGTIATTSSQTIDGSTTYSLSAQYKYVTVQSNGANWIVIANNGLWLIFLLALPLAAAATCAETKVVKIFANKKAA